MRIILDRTKSVNKVKDYGDVEFYGFRCNGNTSESEIYLDLLYENGILKIVKGTEKYVLIYSNVNETRRHWIYWSTNINDVIAEAKKIREAYASGKKEIVYTFN